MTRNWSSILIATTFVISSCATERTKRFESALKDGRCDVALENIPENDKNLKFLGSTQRAAGKMMSYAATGAGYTADVVLTVVGGVVIFSIVCAPFIVAASYGHGGTAQCFPVNLDGITAPEIGKSAYKNTEDMRCPDLTALSRSVRRVARCHSDHATPDGTKNAVTTLNSLKANKKLMGCITKEERENVLADLLTYENKVSSGAH